MSRKPASEVPFILQLQGRKGRERRAPTAGVVLISPTEPLARQDVGTALSVACSGVCVGGQPAKNAA